MFTAAEALAERGPLSRRIEEFRARDAQRAMAAEIERAIDDGATLLCEAGTGTGKTFAYLVPAVLSGKRIIVSTGTRNLQDQLFHRDLPLVCDALAAPVSTALLKGRGNYLCLHRLALNAAVPPGLSPQAAGDLAAIRAWAGRTSTGDRAELEGVPEASPAWRLATSTAENCLGSECPHFDDCHVLEARRRAQEAEVVVVNHHLLFADRALRQEGFGELLPGADAIIVDEAHQLPELATRLFGASLSSAQLVELARDAARAGELEAGDVPELAVRARDLEAAVEDLLGTLGPGPRRVAWERLRAAPGVAAALDELAAALDALGDALGELAERGKELRTVQRRAADNAAKLDTLVAGPEPDWVRWLEVESRSFRWHASPLDVAGLFGGWMTEQESAWILTSATLAVDGRLEPFAERLGLEGSRMHVWESPFDFARQALVYAPPGLPEPRSPEWSERFLRAIVPVLGASEGRAFVLFTSHHALQRAAGELEHAIAFPLLVQGTAPRDELLRRFRLTEGAVLLGTASFWEGVDVRGEALRCVVIDKLPFAPPDDPLHEARARSLRARGIDPFTTYHLPQAVLALKQGVGRLIRDEHDSGVVVLCDPRLLSRPYGRVFLRSLPPMPVSRDLAQVQRFLESGRMTQPAAGDGT